MMKMILSTMTAPQTVCFTATGENGQVVCGHKIKINGGANIADRKTLMTPQGVITELTDEDYDALVKTVIWKKWLSLGLVKPVETHHSAEDTAKEGMAVGDSAMPLTEEDLEGGATAISGDGETAVAETPKPRARKLRKTKK